jgi:RHS repeat-associated protein
MFAKELQTDHHLNGYDYGARYYDPSLARWWNLDPKTEMDYSSTPYAYVVNNPIILVDPNGEEADGYMTTEGEYKWFEDEKERLIEKDNTIWIKFTDDKKHFDLIKSMAENNLFIDPPKIKDKLSKPVGLSKIENWLDSPPKNFLNGVYKTLGNMTYSILNSPKILLTGTTLAGSSANSNEKIEAFIDFVPGLLTYGFGYTGEIFKTKKGIIGYNKFLKEGTVKSFRKGKEWQKEVRYMYHINLENQKIVTPFKNFKRFLNIITTTFKTNKE